MLIDFFYTLRAAKLPVSIREYLTLIEALKAEGFGVLTQVDVQATLKEKIGADFRKYRILGACNPKLAFRALSTELEVGVMMPCNVVVYEGDDGKAVIAAIDPIEFKREKAMEMGATHTFASMTEAMGAVNELTWGEMADRVIMTPGVLHGDMMEEAMALVGKGGTCVVTAISPMTENGTTL